MKAFNPLFRRNRMWGRTWGRGAAMPVAGGKLRLLGLAGIGYGIYRFLQTERGRDLKDKVVTQARDFGERVRTRSNDVVSRSKSRSSDNDRPQSSF